MHDSTGKRCNSFYIFYGQHFRSAQWLSLIHISSAFSKYKWVILLAVAAAAAAGTAVYRRQKAKKKAQEEEDIDDEIS